MNRSVAIIGTRGYPSYYGGFETAVRRLAPYLASRGWDVTVYGRRNATKNDDPLLDDRVRTIVTPGIQTKSISTLSYGLTSIIHASIKKPDVALVMNTANGYFLPILQARQVPTLVNVDGIEWDRDKWGPLAKRVFRGGAIMTSKFGSQMVYDARAIRARWVKEFKVDGVFIPYGGDEPASLPVDDHLTHRGYVLAVARFVPENTVREFLEAASTLSKRWPVVLVGSSGYGGELDNLAEKLAASNSNFRWLGHVSDDMRLHALWQHAGAYFHGHSVGGTNPALVQAMACGAPIVARDTVYNREVLEEGAVFVKPTVSDIVDGVSRLMEDGAEQDRLSELARSRAIADYSWDSVCAKYESALISLVTNPLPGVASATAPASEIDVVGTDLAP